MKVSDATCVQCKSTTERALTILDGVTGAQPDLGIKPLDIWHGHSIVLADFPAAIKAVDCAPEEAT